MPGPGADLEVGEQHAEHDGVERHAEEVVDRRAQLVRHEAALEHADGLRVIDERWRGDCERQNDAMFLRSGEDFGI